MKDAVAKNQVIDPSVRDCVRKKELNLCTSMECASGVQ